jgi:hypothetical protein
MEMVFLMEEFRESIRLYRQLVNYGSGKVQLAEIVNTPHRNQFDHSRESALYYKDLYIDQSGVLDNNYLKNPPDDNTCAECKGHYLGSRPVINHNNDLRIGSLLEDHFMSFMNDKFHRNNIPLRCQRADLYKLNMPDFKIVNTEKNIDVLYFEFKCIFKPFIWVGRKIDGAHCYSHSMTLDCDIKLEKQKQLVMEQNISLKTIYIYWYDIPCVKGVFWQFGDFVYDYKMRAESYTRKKKTGDFRGGKQVGHIDKIYLPLTQMKHFYELFLYLERTLE